MGRNPIGANIMVNSELPFATVDRIVKANNPQIERLAAESTRKLSGLAVEYIVNIANKANIAATHAGRKTVKPEDIDIALNLS